MRVWIDKICLKKRNRNEKYIDVWFSHGVHVSEIFLARLFFSFSSLLLSLWQTHTHTHTHTYILVPFIIHDLLDGRRLYLRRIRHSWLCVLEPNVCVCVYVIKRLFSSSVVYPCSFSCLASSLHILYQISIYSSIDRFLFALRLPSSWRYWSVQSFSRKLHASSWFSYHAALFTSVSFI